MTRHTSKHSGSSIQRARVMDTPSHAYGYKKPFSWIKAIAVVLVAVLVFAGSVFASVYAQFSKTVDDAKVTVVKQKNIKKEVVDPNAGKALNILVLGTDSRDGAANQAIGGANEVGNHQADTTMIVHISANRKFIDIVSIPRDSMVSVSSCETTNGTIPAQSNIMFNSIFATAYSRGNNLSSAATCTMKAVNELTGLDISQFITVDFNGLKSMIDALGGVDVCISEDFSDDQSNLSLNRGLNHLNGTDATQYARTRYSLGDGSDVMRTVRQQYLIKMLIREALKQNILTNFDKLYQLATTALKSLNISEGLASANTLIGLASGLKSFKVANIYSQTVPVQDWTYDRNRVMWTADAQNLWDRIKADRPLTDVALTAEEPSTEKKTDSADTSQHTDAQSSNNAATDSDSSSSDGSQAQPAQTSQPDSNAPDAHTGLITRADGTLIDPGTGGIVDPQSGVIHDPNTNWSIGLAEKYLNYSVCGIDK
ncbi:LCP family protein [Alloscardovia omnicolens]|uniref:LCP family protein n=1 Tax=Alloscardovia omnicolens TaxID=419015 RepID=UPI003A6A8266